jgi:hypothetical protein
MTKILSKNEKIILVLLIVAMGIFLHSYHLNSLGFLIYLKN